MNARSTRRRGSPTSRASLANRVTRTALLCATGFALAASVATTAHAQASVNETRDPKQKQDAEFAKLYAEWTSKPEYGSPLVDHLPLVAGIPTPKDVLGYYIGAPYKLTYYADIVKYYRALAKASPRVKVETIGRSDEGRELVVIYVSSEENIKNLQHYRDNQAKIADPRGRSESEIRTLIATTKPEYHLMGGLHSGETGPSEMLMELAYRLVTETSPMIEQIRNNVIVSITPAADPDGRDRNVDWFYHGLDYAKANGPAAPDTGFAARAGFPPQPAGQLPYWGKYVFHDNNRDINLSQKSMRAITDWYFTAHPPIMHDLHEAQALMYTYSGGPPQNPNLDPLLFAELPFFSNWELSQMTKWGMPGVYTFAFMDGWSPGYLGSVAYNHNGMMRMYETQSGREDSNLTLGDTHIFPIDSGSDVSSVGSAGAAIAGSGGFPHALATGMEPTTPIGAPADATATAAGTRGARPDSVNANAGSGNATGAAGATGAAAANAGATGAGAAGAGRGGRGRGAGAGAAGANAAGGAAAGAGAGAGRGAGAAAGAGAPAAAGAPGGGRGGPAIPTGRGGGEPREWFRGIPIPPNAVQKFSRRNNTNFMQTGVLSALQLTSMFPNLVLENFYTKTKHSLEAGTSQAPYAYVFPVQREMTRLATLINILRAQGIEVGTLNSELTLGADKFPAGSYIVKLNQPYGRLAKNLIERQSYPDPALTTYDDSGWSMGYAFNVDVKEVRVKSVLEAPATLIKSAEVKGKIAGNGTAGLAVAHYGSNNMIAFRYKLKNVAMKIAEASFTAEGVNFPAGSFIVTGSPADIQAARAAVEQFGLTAANLSSAPTVASHDGDVPRVAIFSQWNGTQELGWYRHAFDQFGIPFDLIFKERLEKGDLKKDYDVIIMAAQNVTRTQVFAKKADKPQPYEKTDKFKFLGDYGSTPDMSGGFGQEGVDAIYKFLDQGGTLITTAQSIRFPIEFGLARSIDSENPVGVNAQKPLIQAEITKTDSPMFYGYENKIFPIKFGQGSQLLHIGVADQDRVLAQYVGGENSVLSGLMTNADALKGRAFAVDIPQAHNGNGRVIMFANNPVYRWQNHGEFNMVFNSIMNWNDVPAPSPAPTAAGTARVTPKQH